MTPNEREIETLNGLIKTTIDSVDGYRSAAEDADSTQYQAMFFERANERSDVRDKLQNYVRKLGGDPETSGSVVAGAHRTFMNIKDAITGKDDTAVVNEVERGEDLIKARFEEAISDTELSSEARSVVTECYASVKSGHDQMSNLKHSLNA